MSPVAIGPSVERFVLGIMVDFGKSIPYYLEPGQWDGATLRTADDMLAETLKRTGFVGDRIR